MYHPENAAFSLAQDIETNSNMTHLFEEPNCAICPGAVGMGTPSSWRRASSADLIRSSFRLSIPTSADWLAAAPAGADSLAGATASMSCCARLVPLPGTVAGLVAWSPVCEVEADLGLEGPKAANSLLPRPVASDCAMDIEVSGLPDDLIQEFGAGYGIEGLRATYTFLARICSASVSQANRSCQPQGYCFCSSSKRTCCQSAHFTDQKAIKSVPPEA